MSWRVIVCPKAEADLAQAARWYEAQRQKLGGQFLDEIRRVLGLLERAPERHPVYYRGFRRRQGELNIHPATVTEDHDEKGKLACLLAAWTPGWNNIFGVPDSGNREQISYYNANTCSERRAASSSRKTPR